MTAAVASGLGMAARTASMSAVETVAGADIGSEKATAARPLQKPPPLPPCGFAARRPPPSATG